MRYGERCVTWLWATVFVLAQLVALCVIPLGLPGTWLQVVAAAVAVWATDRPIGWLLVLVVLAVAGEIAEMLSGQWGARRFGGSPRAAWGALIGGFAGLFIGTPVPLVGSLVMSFVGSFVGAIVGEMSGRRQIAPELRVGLGAVLGRALGIAAKLGVGFVIAILSVAGLVMGAR
jgi:uncharacterized protein YqgC (DUF456 family)